MLNKLIKDFEKVLLALLLILLAVSSTYALKSIDVIPIVVDGGSLETEIDEVPEIIDHADTLKEYAGILTPHDVVYCRNIECSNIISKKFTRCSLCSTEIYKNEVVESDLNDNSIPDKIELSWGGELNDPLNHTRDLDGDGFRNIDEFHYNESPHDPESHPLYIYLACFTGVEKKLLPITFSNVEKLEGKNGSKFYASGKYHGKWGFYRSVGESVYGIQIVSINEEESSVSILYKNETLEVPLDKRISAPGWPKYKIKFMDSELKLQMGQKFSLKNESYSLISAMGSSVEVLSRGTKEKVFVKNKARLPNPDK